MEPVFDDATERIYQSLPQHYRDSDLKHDWVLKKFIAGLVAGQTEVDTLIDRFTYTPINEGGEAGDTSDLVDPRTADRQWLKWLGQLFGTRVQGPVTEDTRQQIIAGSGFRAGTRSSMIAAAQSVLTGDKKVRLIRHADMSWQPDMGNQVARTNLAPRPNMESIANITATGAATLAQDTSWKQHGTNSLSITSTGDAEAGAWVTGEDTASLIYTDFLTGGTYTISAYVRSNATLTTTGEHEHARKIVVEREDIADVVYPDFAVSNQGPETAGVERVSVTFTVPEDTSRVSVRLMNGSAATGEVVWWDSVLIEEGDYVRDYFDGTFQHGIVNAMTNGGFETAGTELLTGWSAQISATQSTEQVRTDTYSMKTERVSSGSVSSNAYSFGAGTPLDLGYKTGDRVTGSVWIYVPGVVDNGLMRLSLYGTGIAELEEDHWIVESVYNHWYRLTVTGTVIDESGTILFGVSAPDNVGDYVYWDDISLVSGTLPHEDAIKHTVRWVDGENTSASEMYLPAVVDTATPWDMLVMTAQSETPKNALPPALAQTLTPTIWDHEYLSGTYDSNAVWKTLVEQPGMYQDRAFSFVLKDQSWRASVDTDTGYGAGPFGHSPFGIGDELTSQLRLTSNQLIPVSEGDPFTYLVSLGLLQDHLDEKAGRIGFIFYDDSGNPLENVYTTNLATDPSFENGTGGFTSPANGTVSQDSTHFYSGSSAIKLTKTASGVFNPVQTVSGVSLKAGDVVNARVQAFVPELLEPLPLWTANSNYGTGVTVSDPSAPGGEYFEWTATADQTVNASLFSPARIPVLETDTLSTTFSVRKGNTQAPDAFRFLLLCYDNVGSYLGTATGGTNRFLITDDWMDFSFSGMVPQPGTVEVAFAFYASSFTGEEYFIGDIIHVADPILTRPITKPFIRLGGSGLDGMNSDPYPQDKVGEWATLETSVTVDTTGSTLLIYLYGQDPINSSVWYDDLSIVVNGEPIQFNGATISDDRFQFRWKGAPGASPSEMYASDHVEEIDIVSTQLDTSIEARNYIKSTSTVNYAPHANDVAALDIQSFGQFRDGNVIRCQVNSQATTNEIGVFPIQNLGIQELPSGTRFTFSVDVRIGENTAANQLRFFFRDDYAGDNEAANIFLSTPNIVSNPITGRWQRHYITGTVKDARTLTTAYVVLEGASDQPIGSYIDTANWMLTEGEEKLDYFNGDTDQDTDFTYQWDGIPNNSTSSKVLTTVAESNIAEMVQYDTRFLVPIGAVNARVVVDMDGFDGGDTLLIAQPAVRQELTLAWSPYDADPVKAIVDAGVKPAGVRLHWKPLTTDWDTLTNFGTRPWREVEDSWINIEEYGL